MYAGTSRKIVANIPLQVAFVLLEPHNPATRIQASPQPLFYLFRPKSPSSLTTFPTTFTTPLMNYHVSVAVEMVEVFFW